MKDKTTTRIYTYSTYHGWTHSTGPGVADNILSMAIFTGGSSYIFFVQLMERRKNSVHIQPLMFVVQGKQIDIIDYTISTWTIIFFSNRKIKLYYSKRGYRNKQIYIITFCYKKTTFFFPFFKVSFTKTNKFCTGGHKWISQ